MPKLLTAFASGMPLPALFAPSISTSSVLMSGLFVPSACTSGVSLPGLSPPGLFPLFPI